MSIVHLSASDDTAALEIVRMMPRTRTLELWRRGVFVGRFEGPANDTEA